MKERIVLFLRRHRRIMAITLQNPSQHFFNPQTEIFDVFIKELKWEKII